MKKIDVAVIGLGVGFWHLNAYLKSKNINNIFICDFNKNLEKKIQRISKRIVISTFKNILKNDKIKIVSIASYDNFHCTQITQSFNNKKNVFVEKPMCMSKNELNKILKKQRQTKKYLSSNLVLRANPLFINIKKKIKNRYIWKSILYRE